MSGGGGMTLQTLDFARLLPQFMRDDPAIKGMAAAINSIIPGLSRSVKRLSTWDIIDELTETELDELAWELNILWYDKAAPIATKRQLVKDSDRVYRHLGTKWAVENVIRAYFGDGKIEEWFEYGGQPGHFRVVSSNPSLNAEKITEFMALLGSVKRHSSHLDVITINLAADIQLAAGVAVAESGREAVSLGASAPT